MKIIANLKAFLLVVIVFVSCPIPTFSQTNDQYLTKVPPTENSTDPQALTLLNDFNEALKYPFSTFATHGQRLSLYASDKDKTKQKVWNKTMRSLTKAITTFSIINLGEVRELLGSGQLSRETILASVINLYNAINIYRIVTVETPAPNADDNLSSSEEKCQAFFKSDFFESDRVGPFVSPYGSLHDIASGILMGDQNYIANVRDDSLRERLTTLHNIIAEEQDGAIDPIYLLLLTSGTSSTILLKELPDGGQPITGEDLDRDKLKAGVWTFLSDKTRGIKFKTRTLTDELYNHDIVLNFFKDLLNVRRQTDDVVRSIDNVELPCLFLNYADYFLTYYSPEPRSWRDVLIALLPEASKERKFLEKHENWDGKVTFRTDPELFKPWSD